jgi:hypothetical protein
MFACPGCFISGLSPLPAARLSMLRERQYRFTVHDQSAGFQSSWKVNCKTILPNVTKHSEKKTSRTELTSRPVAAEKSQPLPVPAGLLPSSENIGASLFEPAKGLFTRLNFQRNSGSHDVLRKKIVPPSSKCGFRPNSTTHTRRIMFLRSKRIINMFSQSIQVSPGHCCR